MNIINPDVASAASTYNEATVRFRVIDPILKSLGYVDGQDLYINLEEKLSWPYVHIGRKSKKDVPVGYPDYRVGLKGARGSFIVEAKAGNVIISDTDVEQAHSYAAHAQVGANYFVLCNGIEFKVYETLSGPNCAPLLSLPVSEVNQRFFEIENILSPVRLEANCKTYYDMGLKLCDGVGSSLRVRSGAYKLSEYGYRIFINDQDQTDFIKTMMPNLQAMENELELFKSVFQLRIEDGAMGRDQEGRIYATAKLSGATIPNYEGMKLMGIDELSLATNSEFLSKDIDCPTVFESTKDFSLSQGTSMPQLFGGVVQLDRSVVGDLFVRYAMYLDGRNLKGQYVAVCDYHSQLPMVGALRAELDFMGEFEMVID